MWSDADGSAKDLFLDKVLKSFSELDSEIIKLFGKGKNGLKKTPTAVRVILLTSQLHCRMAAADAYERRSFLWSGASRRGAGWSAPIYPWGAWLLEKRGEGENAREADGPKDTIGEPT